jgi:hypothetical protein
MVNGLAQLVAKRASWLYLVWIPIRNPSLRKRISNIVELRLILERVADKHGQLSLPPLSV